MADRPNIIFIFPDQHRGDTMGCAGNPALTPNLDKLAAEGVHFGRCSTNSPLCMPARASLITGKYVNEHGTWANSTIVDPHSVSHVRNIRDAGYHTAVIGKTHLHYSWRPHTKEGVPILNDWGYEDTHELQDIMAYGGAQCYYTDYLREKNKLQVFREYMRNHARAEVSGWFHPWETPPALIPTEETLDMYCASTAEKWIKSYKEDKPFYLQVCFPGPHNPFDSPSEFRALHKPEDMPLAIMGPHEGPVAPRVQGLMRGSRLQDMTECQNRLMRSYYYAKVTQVDYGVGIVIKALEEKGMMDNTWIIYTSDHGELLGDHRCNHKGIFYEGCLNVPLIIRPPGGTQGWKTKALTDHFDVTDTMLDVTGARPLENSHGSSLAPKIKAGPDASDAQKGKEVIFSEVFLNSMARNEQYKMNIDSLTREPLELYDMVNDPTELRNLVNEPSLKNVREEFLNEYFSQLLANLDQVTLKTYQEADPRIGTWAGARRLLEDTPLPP